MDMHGIDVSLVSSANPWLDFLSPDTAEVAAAELNQDLEEYCSSAPSIKSGASSTTLSRLYGFGLLPLVPGISSTAVLDAVKQISTLPHLKGLILGTRGIGKGLDDPALDCIWEAIAKLGLVVFLHPHYGVDGGAWGETDNGHVLPLALGFPFETTVVRTLHNFDSVISTCTGSNSDDPIWRF
jgi:aminocarboxymuconate-semialdehyde decarboxylase